MRIEELFSYSFRRLMTEFIYYEYLDLKQVTGKKKVEDRGKQRRKIKFVSRVKNVWNYTS